MAVVVPWYGMPKLGENDRHRHLKREARARTALVERVLCDLDPYSVLAGGGPTDEYSPEAALIAARWKVGMPLETLATAIEAVWNSQFEPASRGPATDAHDLAHEIAERLIAGGTRRA